MSVAAGIPPIAVVPMTGLATPPDPDAVQSDTQPRMNANDVRQALRSLPGHEISERRPIAPSYNIPYYCNVHSRGEER